MSGQKRAFRPIEKPKPVSLAGGLALRLAEAVRDDESLSEGQKLQAYQSLPRNRAQARRLLRGNGPWGLAKPRRGEGWDLTPRR